MLKTLVPVFFSIALAARASAAAPQAGPTITFGPTTVTATGATPGASVVFYGVGLEPLGYVSQLVHFQAVVADDDHDGTVVFDLKQDVPLKTCWAVVDLTNGQYAMAAPKYGLDVAPPSRVSVQRGSAGLADTFAISLNAFEALYVHPGLGAWSIRAQDRAKKGRDVHGVGLVSLNELKPVMGGGAAAPAELRPGGLLIAVDYSYLRIVAVRIDGAMLGGAK